MPRKENYERLSIEVKNQNTENLVYEIKLYLESIFENCDVSYFSLTCDGEKINSYEYLEEYSTINYILRYHTQESYYGKYFYSQYCKGISKKELHVFGMTNIELPQMYMYDGCEITELFFEKMTKITDIYQSFEAQPLSMIFQIPEKEYQEQFTQLLKSWVEIGSEFYEECSDIEIIDGYVSYLVEPSYIINRDEFVEVIELYNQLFNLLKQLKGRLISVQPLFISYHPSQDIVIKIEKNNVGIYYTEPFIYPVLN